MKIALDDGELECLSELAHWLKGSGGTAGFDCFTHPASQMEQAAKNKEAADCIHSLERIVKLTNRVEPPSNAVVA